MMEPFQPEVQLTRTNNGDVVAFTAKSMKELIDHINSQQITIAALQIQLNVVNEVTRKMLSELEAKYDKHTHLVDRDGIGVVETTITSTDAK